MQMAVVMQSYHSQSLTLGATWIEFAPAVEQLQPHPLILTYYVVHIQVARLHRE